MQSIFLLSVTTTAVISLFYCYLFVFGALVFVAEGSFSLVQWVGLLSSCRALISHCGGLSYCGAQAVGRSDSVVGARGLGCPMHVGSSWTRGHTFIPLIGRQILNHWITTEVPKGFWYACVTWSLGLVSILTFFLNSDPISHSLCLRFCFFSQQLWDIICMAYNWLIYSVQFSVF